MNAIGNSKRDNGTVTLTKKPMICACSMRYDIREFELTW